MAFRTLGRAVCLGAMALVVFSAACSSSSSPAEAAVIKATIGAAAGKGGLCSGYQSATPVIPIGDPASTPVRQKDGDTTSAGKVSVSCKVSGNGSYSINLNATLNAPTESTSGSITITGMGVTAQGGTADVSISVSGGSYSQTGCAITYTYLGEALDTANGVGGVGSGKFWGHVSCVNAMNPSQTVGQGQLSTCDVEADVLFENCGS